MRDILNSYTSKELKSFISQYNKKLSLIKGYSKLKKAELIALMTKQEHVNKFRSIKMKVKAPKTTTTTTKAPKPAPKATKAPKARTTTTKARTTTTKATKAPKTKSNKFFNPYTKFFEYLNKNVKKYTNLEKLYNDIKENTKNIFTSMGVIETTTPLLEYLENSKNKEKILKTIQDNLNPKIYNDENSKRASYSLVNKFMRVRPGYTQNRLKSSEGKETLKRNYSRYLFRGIVDEASKFSSQGRLNETFIKSYWNDLPNEIKKNTIQIYKMAMKPPSELKTVTTQANIRKMNGQYLPFNVKFVTATYNSFGSHRINEYTRNRTRRIDDDEKLVNKIQSLNSFVKRNSKIKKPSFSQIDERTQYGLSYDDIFKIVGVKV